MNFSIIIVLLILLALVGIKIYLTKDIMKFTSTLGLMLEKWRWEEQL